MVSALEDPYQDGLRLAENGQYAEAIGAFEQALKKRPNDPKVLFALAGTARDLRLPVVAEKFYAKVLAVEPDRLEAVVSLANLLREGGRLEEAETVLDRVLPQHPQAPELWLTLGSVFRDAGNDAQAEIFYRQALALRPGYLPAQGNLADIFADRGQESEALALYETILSADANNAQAHFSRATIRLASGDFMGGWADYAARKNVRHSKVPVPDHHLPLWNGAYRSGLRLLVTAEQGIGDQIMFAGLISDLQKQLHAAGGSLILECDTKLVELFSRSFVPSRIYAWNIDTRGRIVRSKYDWLNWIGGADAYIEMGSLPALLRPDLSSFPNPNIYLRPNPEQTAFWQTQFAALPRPIIGLCWRSGKQGGGRARQYAPLEHWGRFIRNLAERLHDDVTFVMAQYDSTAEEISTLEQFGGHPLVIPAGLDQKNSLDRTAAMLSVLDGVVSAPTAVAWLAAAAGTPVLKVECGHGWTSFGQTFEPFAPAARCVVPSTLGDWTAAFDLTLERLVRDICLATG